MNLLVQIYLANLVICFFVFQLGEKGSGVRQRATDAQDFYQLRDQCLRNGELFEDPEFEAAYSSLFYSQTPPRSFQWMRPKVSFYSYISILEVRIVIFFYSPSRLLLETIIGLELRGWNVFSVRCT